MQLPLPPAPRFWILTSNRIAILNILNPELTGIRWV